MQPHSPKHAHAYSVHACTIHIQTTDTHIRWVIVCMVVFSLIGVSTQVWVTANIFYSSFIEFLFALACATYEILQTKLQKQHHPNRKKKQLLENRFVYKKKGSEKRKKTLKRLEYRAIMWETLCKETNNRVCTDRFYSFEEKKYCSNFKTKTIVRFS